MNFEERKAEIFRRSDARIAKRKRDRRIALGVCTTVVALAIALPFALSNDKTEAAPGKEMMAAAENMPICTATNEIDNDAVNFIPESISTGGNLSIGCTTSPCANSVSPDNMVTSPEQVGSAIDEMTGDYPAMIMVDGTLYYLDAVVGDVDESAIIGYTTSYTDHEPKQHGEVNFNRELGLPFAKVEDGIAVLYQNKWHLFVSHR